MHQIAPLRIPGILVIVALIVIMLRHICVELLSGLLHAHRRKLVISVNFPNQHPAFHILDEGIPVLRAIVVIPHIREQLFFGKFHFSLADILIFSVKGNGKDHPRQGILHFQLFTELAELLPAFVEKQLPPVKDLIPIADIRSDYFELLEHFPAVQVLVVHFQHFIADLPHGISVTLDLFMHFIKSGFCIRQLALKKRRQFLVTGNGRKRLIKA